MQIYDRIKAIAKEKKITIAEIERKAGLGNASIGKWNRVSPKVDTLQKVADALGVSVSEIIEPEKANLDAEKLDTIYAVALKVDMLLHAVDVIEGLSNETRD